MALVALALAACGGTDVRIASDPADASPTPSVVAAPSPVTPSAPTPAPDADPAPSPDERIPLSAARLVRALEATAATRRAAVRGWLDAGGASSWPPPREVELLALHEQRIYRTLAARDRLAARVLERLDGRLAREARANVAAGGALYDHFSPVHRVPDFRIGAPLPAEVLHRAFLAAERRFGVDWEVLAAVMLIETRMGRIRSGSSAGAQGPMQFLPSTWAAYGLGGDVHDERDAIMGAANYLRASGAPQAPRQAIHAYNPVDAYVTAVTRYAAAMRRDPELFYTYYLWQVFVRTTRGDVLLSGPGAAS